MKYCRSGLSIIALTLFSLHISAQPATTIDLATTPTGNGTLLRVYGYTGSGSSGLPVVGGADVDGDGFTDYAMAAMRASPGGRSEAGEVYLIFGNGSISGTLDTSQSQSRILRISGAAAQEHSGSELWMEDVTGDGLGDLMICRQDHTPAGGPVGAGALTIVKGGAELRSFAATLAPLDLAAPPAALTLTTITGAATQDRLCTWARSGDVNGDGIADILVAADQAGPAAGHHGALYVILGGAHLALNQNIDLAGFGTATPPLPGRLARIDAPPGSAHYHLGGTCQLGDLDGNNRADIMVAATLNRAGAALAPAGASEVVHSSGGVANGRLYIVWDDNFPAGPWPASLQITIDSTSGSQTTINGRSDNDNFGEEILGGLDYNANNQADLFVGDLTGNPNGNRFDAGIADVFYDVVNLKGQTINLDTPPAGLAMTTFFGPLSSPPAISTDTAMHGDFNGDGIADLTFSSPHDDPFGRRRAGTLHVFFGKTGGWPALVDLNPGSLPPSAQIEIAEIYGARGDNGDDTGDTLAYSGDGGDINGDGITDIITNEMVGNGIAANSIDVGNLIIINGAALQLLLFSDQFENPR